MDLDSVFRALPAVIALVAFGIVALAGVIVFFAFRGSGVWNQLGRAMAAGTPSPQQTEVERMGRVGEATVLDRVSLETVAKNRTMVYEMGSLVLEVRLPGLPPYRAQCRQWFIASQWWGVSQGSVVPVRVDPRDPQIVFVDIDARKRAAQDAEWAERDAHLRRQAELLGQNRR